MSIEIRADTPHISLMDRRVFIQLMSAFGLAPKLPALGPSVSVSIASPVANYTASQYALGCYYLESRGARSALELGKWLQVSPASAELLMGDFIKNGVAAPLADGLARAVNPLSTASEKLDNQIFTRAKSIVEDIISDDKIEVIKTKEDIEIMEFFQNDTVDEQA